MKILRDDCPISDWVMLIAMTDIYIEVMTEKSRMDLVEKAMAIKEKLVA